MNVPADPTKFAEKNETASAAKSRRSIDTRAEAATSGEVLILAVVPFSHYLGSGLVFPKLAQDKAAWT
jgi:hypothetical protein